MAWAGLCESCAHRKEIRSDRGSVFTLCLLSFENSAFAKYPRLPVVECAGFRAAAETRSLS